MKIIHKHLKLIEDIVGFQKYSDNSNFRLLKYVKVLHIEEGVLLYNVLTRCMVLLDVEEYNDLYNIAELKELWFVVSCDFEDKKFCIQIKELYKLFDQKEININSYTIFTTTDCNAHCYYCFERGVKRINMPHKVAVDTAKYIIKNSGKRKITLWWFGGEPLYNLDAIDTICRILNEEKIDYVSKVVSNGYLFNSELIAKGKSFWNLIETQITLDGTRDIYNKTKAYSYKNINAFEVVLNNIKKLVEAEINVNIRLNVSDKNQDNLLELIDVLHSRIENNRYLKIYSHSLFDSRGYKGVDTLDNERKNYLQRSLLQDKIDKYGYDIKKTIPGSLTLNNCMADSDRNCSISPLGLLGKCQSFYDSEFYGSIYNDEIDDRVIKKFKEKDADISECDNCCFYPDCHKLVMCPNLKKCDEFYRTEKNNKIIKQMLETYKQFVSFK